MARVLHRNGFSQSFEAASAISPQSVVTLDTVENQVKPVASLTQRPFGVADASVAQGANVTVYEAGNVVKAVAAASIGFGAEVAVAAAGTQSLGVAGGASGVTRWAVGQALDSAAAGETFSLYVSPRQLSNLI